MTLTTGTRLGPYEITALLGAGGMGEVYRARDPRLGRDVAIKALPAGFAQDPERLARFEREAKLLASLNHPNIAAIHGVESDGGRHLLVLEYVPPRPSICMGSGLPMMSSISRSRSSPGGGRSLAWRNTPLLVPPRIRTTGTEVT